MAATIGIYRWTGPSGSIVKTQIDSSGGSGSSRMSTSDSPTPGTNNPVPIPAAGSNYSFWVSTRLNCTVAPTGTVDNLRWYTDGSNSLGTGVLLNMAKASTGADSGYREATGTVGSTGTQLTQVNHTGLDEAPANAFTYTSVSPKSLTGSITATTGEFGDLAVYQLEVQSTAGAGTTASETITWKYDET